MLSAILDLVGDAVVTLDRYSLFRIQFVYVLLLAMQRSLIGRGFATAAFLMILDLQGHPVCGIDGRVLDLHQIGESLIVAIVNEHGGFEQLLVAGK